MRSSFAETSNERQQNEGDGSDGGNDDDERLSTSAHHGSPPRTDARRLPTYQEIYHRHDHVHAGPNLRDITTAYAVRAAHNIPSLTATQTYQLDKNPCDHLMYRLWLHARQRTHGGTNTPALHPNSESSVRMDDRGFLIVNGSQSLNSLATEVSRYNSMVHGNLHSNGDGNGNGNGSGDGIGRENGNGSGNGNGNGSDDDSDGDGSNRSTDGDGQSRDDDPNDDNDHEL